MTGLGAKPTDLRLGNLSAFDPEAHYVLTIEPDHSMGVLQPVVRALKVLCLDCKSTELGTI